MEVTSTEAVDTDMDTDITAGETSMETVAMAAVATVAMAAVAVGMVVIMVVVVVVTVGDDNHMLNIFIIGESFHHAFYTYSREYETNHFFIYFHEAVILEGIGDKIIFPNILKNK